VHKGHNIRSHMIGCIGY